MDGKRTTAQIDAELETLRAKLRGLEADRQQHGKALERAKADRKKSAYAAHGEKDPKAQERLAKARMAQRDSELALEDLESAIAEGRARFEALQREYEQAYHQEQWARVEELAKKAVDKEAAEFDTLMQGVADFLQRHAATLQAAYNLANGMGWDLQHFDARHLVRCMHGYLFPILPGTFDKPSDQYRRPYAEVLAQAWRGAQQRVSADRKQLTESQNGGYVEATGNGHGPEAEVGSTA